MLLTCPECGARYDIDGSLIPPDGRRVQCSACNHVWQQDPGADDEDAATLRAGDAEELPRERPPLAEDVKAILREEAEHETRRRRERGMVEIPPERSAGSEDSSGAFRPHAVSGPLPDADAINATLRAASARAAESRGGQGRPGRRGFAAGLTVGLALVGLAAALYLSAPTVAETLPETAPALESYVALVDDLRVSLDRTADRAMAAVGLSPPEG